MLFWLVIFPILIAIFLYISPFNKTLGLMAIIAQAVLTLGAFYIFMACKGNDLFTAIGNFPGVLGISLKADTFSSVFILLTCVIFLIAAAYNYHERLGRIFWFLMFIWEGLLIGIFLSQDLFNIFVLVEVATVVISILIMFNRDTRSMHDGMVYLMVNTVAVQFYLLGIGYIYKLTGALDIEAASQALKHLDKSLVILPYALIVTSVSLKCALMPLFSWLPKAHSTPGAPSAVSAILSGLHIKSGIFLFIRFQAIFSQVNVSEFLLGTGIITGIVGFLFALSQTDIKLILAYHTVSQIGMIMIGLNMDNVFAHTGGIYHIINHAFFKMLLFLNAGVIIQRYGTRNIYEIKGVLKRMPLTGITTLIAVLSITGAPFFSGSVSKYFIMSGTNWFINAVIIFINLGTIISFIKYSSMLTGSVDVATTAAKKTDGGKIFSVLVLSVLCLSGGIFGRQFIAFLFNERLEINPIAYIQKVGIFVPCLAAGFLIYKYYVKKSLLLKKIRGIELGFKGICVSLGVFFAITLLYAKFFAS